MLEDLLGLDSGPSAPSFNQPSNNGLEDLFGGSSQSQPVAQSNNTGGGIDLFSDMMG
jgi:hypothetical protein